MKPTSVTYWRERFSNAHPRTRKAQINILLGLIVKGGGMLISLLLVPLTIDYLSKEVYGTWLTISSIVTMMTFLDIGIGNGLRNKFSEAIAVQDIKLARAYVSTAYAIFGAIQLILVSIFLIVVWYIPWQRIFNTQINVTQLQTVVLITVLAMAVKLLLDILSYVLFALQESSVVGFMTFLTNLLTLVGTYALSRFTESSLIYIAAMTAVTPIVIITIAGIILYWKRLRIYRPAIKLVNTAYASSLLSLGYKFFAIQIAVIVLFYTDNIIITQLFGPSEVTTYNVAFRYFNAINTIFAIAITPYWSAFTEAAVKNDQAWMVRTYTYLQKLWLILVILVVLMTVLAEPVYSFWIGNRVTIPPALNMCMGLFIIISCWNSTAVAVVNGLGKIRLQLYYSTFSAIINIPLAITLGRTLHMGSAGVILATSLCLLIGSVYSTMQAKKLIAGTATGIWNQ